MKQLLILLGGVKVGFLIGTAYYLYSIIKVKLTPSFPYVLIMLGILVFLMQQVRVLVLAARFAPKADVVSLVAYTLVAMFLFAGFRRIALRVKNLL